MKDELDKLSQSIEQTVMGLDTIIAEKLKLEIKLKNIQTKFIEKKKHKLPVSIKLVFGDWK